MKSLRIITLLTFVMLAFAISASAQVNVNPGAGSYATLSAAFAAINAGTHTGAITVDIVGDTTEPVGGAILNASGVGAASYTSIVISPSGGAARTITGAATAGLPLIDFVGADNVTINGLNTGGNSLTISNTTVSAASGTGTMRFTTDATSNTITNASILGSATMAVGTNGGNISFASAAVTTGNDNNTVSNCNLGPAGANLPSKVLHFSGTSNTDPGTANSGIVINNNNIFDYFSATVSSGGIDLNSGTVGTQITNNRFYQTATRTMTTTSLTHSGIRISNTSGAYTITGNTIGFASNTGTGTYTLVFPASTSGGFIPINLSVNTTPSTSVQGNTIAGIAMSGAGSGTSSSALFRGIYVSSGLTNIGDITGNTIGSQSATGSITYTSSSTSATDVMGMFNFGSSNWTVSNNNIGGITASNSSTGAANVYGIRLNTSSTATTTISNNLVGGTVANSLQSTAAAATAGTQVAGIFVSTSIATLTGNTIRNLTAPGGTGTTTAASVVGIAFVSSTPVNNAAQNTIFNLSNTNTTAATIVTGIQFTGGTGNVVERNFIHSLTSATTSATAEVNGIRVAGGTTTYRNNMIAIGAGIANALGGAATNAGTSGINGINEALGTDSFFHNSVYIGGSPTAGTGASYAFNGVQTINTRSFRDNIFFNARSNSGATGKNYAVKINGTAANPSGLTINNNLYFANGTGAVFGFFNSLDVANLAAWKVAVGQDAGSFESNPQYNDPTNATPDLHLHPTNATVAEGNGVDLGVTNDFDGQTRSGLTPVDIGADAGNFVGIDLAGPTITYTAFGNTSSTGDRMLVTTVTDNSGVPTMGVGLPVIYYRKNMGAWASTQCSFISGNNYDCTIVAAAVGGVVVTDVIQYYVVAQDTVGNVSANPSGGAGGFTINPPAAATPPTTPNQYTIVAAIGGSLNVGTGETYTSLTNAGGIFEAINNAEVTSNITINLTSNLAGELGTVALNEFASPFTILIKPSGAPRTITGSNAVALIRLNAADRVRFDGSTAASLYDSVVGGNPALRELTVQNTNVSTTAWVFSIASNGTNGAQNNTIKNINVLGQDPTTTNGGISLGGATPGTAATSPNNNNRVENCSLKRAITGIYSAGVSAIFPNTGTVITQNETSDVTADRIRRVGIVVFNENGVQITENSINGISTNESADAVGIGLGNQSINDTTTTSGLVTNALVSRNKINGVASLSTTGFSAAGITVAGTAGGANTIANNMITGVTAPATSPDIVAGIFVVGALSSNTKLYHNSVAMSGDRGAVASQMPSFGVAVTGTDPTVEMKNNIFFTNQIASGGGVNAVSYAIGMVTTTFANLDSNYNDFYSTSGTAFRSGSLGAAAGTSYATLALWQAAVADDANSQEVDPMFNVVANDLHLNIPATPLLGDGITGFATVDYDNDPRPASNPEIGADEVVQAVGGVVPAGTFYNAQMGSGSTDTLAGNVTITNRLDLSGGETNTGANTLTLGCDAVVSGSGGSNYVIGNFRKEFCTTGTFTFPVGTASDAMLLGAPPEYSPFTANVTAIATVPSSLTVFVVDNFFPNGMSATQSASRHWDVTESGDLTADISFTYLDGDINGTETSYNVLRRAGGITNTYPGGTVNDVTNTATAPGVMNFSQWGAGNLAPLAAGVSVGGRVLRADGQGIGRARLVLTDSQGNSRITQTNAFGYYNFEDVENGQTVSVAVSHKQYIFNQPVRVINLGESVTDADFISDGANDLLNTGDTYFDKAPFDFDGDGRTDISVFRAAKSTWMINRSSDNTWTRATFGLPTDLLAPADFDGDGRTDYAVFRANEGTWYIWNSATNDLRVERHGNPGDVPVPSDVDGDGRADFILWNASRSTWSVLQSSDGRTVEIAVDNTDKTSVPMLADYDTDGKADLTIFVKSSGTWRITLSSTGETVAIKFGDRNGSAMMGDFDGDFHADLAIYNQGVWTIRSSRTGEISTIENAVGGAITGDFDGDNRLDASVYQNGRWTLRQSGSGFVRVREFGANGDLAIPSIFVR